MRRSMKYLAVLLSCAMALQGTSVLTMADEIADVDLVAEESMLPAAEEELQVQLAGFADGEIMEELELPEAMETVLEDAVEIAPEEEGLSIEELTEAPVALEEEIAPAQDEVIAAEETLPALEDGFAVLPEEDVAIAEPVSEAAADAADTPADTEVFAQEEPAADTDVASLEQSADTADASLEQGVDTGDVTLEPVLDAGDAALELPAETEVTDVPVDMQGEEAVEAIAEEEMTESADPASDQAQSGLLVVSEEEAAQADASVENAANPTSVSDTFTDVNFAKFVKDHYTSGSNTITSAQLKAIKAATTLDLSGYAVASLKGIEYFEKVQTLKLSGNTVIKTVNLSKNPSLVIVDLSGNTAMQTLTLTGCANIQQLNISGCTKLENVDLTACTALTTLNAQKAGLKSLALNKNTKLQTLNASDTQIETLDVSANTSLRQISAGNTMLSAVTLGTNANLFYLDLSDNKRLSKIDVSKVTALRELQLQNTAVVSLDLSNHATLYRLDLSNTPLKTLNLSGCKAIESLDINNRTGKGWNVTTITTLNVSNCTALRYLYCNQTAVSSLTITGCSTLEELECNNTAISALTLTDCAALHHLYCGDTAITALDVSKNKNLRTLNCSNTGINALNVTNNESLTSLNVEETGITSLDLRKNPNLAKLYCGRTMTKIYLNELKNNAAGTGRVILDTGKYNNASARIIAYFPLNGTSWNKTTRNTYSAKSANITWWPYDPLTGTIYCKGSEEANGLKTGEHNWATVYDVKPNCSTSGKTHVECKACGEVKPGTSKVVKATGKHTYGKWTLKTEANAYSPAIQHKVCKFCKHEVTRTKGKALKAATTVFRNLQLRAKAASSTKVKLTWNTLSGAYVYYVYGAKCGNSIKLLKSVKQPKKAAKTLSFTHSGLKAGTYYKYGVAAYKKDASGNLVLMESASQVHVPTTGGKYTEYKNAVASRKKVSLKASKSIRVRTAANKKVASKTAEKHVVVRYESSNKAVVSVNKKGKITAKKAGTAIVYAYLQDGVFAKIKVTVK